MGYMKFCNSPALEVLNNNDILCRVSFAVTGLYCGIFWARKDTFEAIGGFAEKKAMEDVATAKRLKELVKWECKESRT